MRCYTLTASLIACLFAAAPAMKSQDVLSKTKRSGPYSGGAGSGYSEWYLLKSDPAPPGYILSDAQFQLEGSGSCGLNAQCLEGERTQTQSIWLFRIQGQTVRAGGPAGSEAVLTAKYSRAGAETTYTLTERTPERFSSAGDFFGCFDAKGDHAAGDGPWCSISAEPPKSGYRIKSASFNMEGDRDCTGNDFDREVREPAAQCRMTTRTDTKVTWQFRMLGHDEDAGKTAGKSFGTLKVTYEKIP
jgi:hypothetical protein